MIHGYDNSSEEFWEIDGESLHQYGWSCSTVGGTRLALPPRRGENQVYAYRPGAMFRPKLADQRPLTLAMWVTGQYDLATGLPSADHVVAWNDAWNFLRNLVWKIEGQQFTLTRRWKLTVAGTPTLVVADAQAELSGTLEPTMTGRTRADFQMDLTLADPYFYGRADPDTANSKTEITFNRDEYTNVLNAGADFVGYGGDMLVVFYGPLTNPVLANYGPPDTPFDAPIWAKYNGTIAAGDSVRLYVPDFTCSYYDVSAGRTTNTIEKVTNSGARHWFGLMPKVNRIRLTADSGTGTAQIRFRPPYV